MSWIFTSTARQHQLDGAGAIAHGNAPGPREIAHSLAQINRFTGHASRPYSVAEHSLLVMEIARTMFYASPLLQLAALLHDAHECVTGDVSSPVKQVLGTAWADFEDAQQANLMQHYGLTEVWETHHATIKICDLIALATERRDLMPFDAIKHDPWPILDTPGAVVEPFSVILKNRARAERSWAIWAFRFEQTMHEYIGHAKYELEGATP